MINLDYAPAVFAGLIIFTVLSCVIYGLVFVDAYWKKNKESVTAGDDVFN